MIQWIITPTQVAQAGLGCAARSCRVIYPSEYSCFYGVLA